MARYLHKARACGVKVITGVLQDHSPQSSTLPTVKLWEEGCMWCTRQPSSCDAAEAIIATYTRTTYASQQHGLYFLITPAQRSRQPNDDGKRILVGSWHTYYLNSDEVAPGGVACAETRHPPTRVFANAHVDLKALLAAPQVAVPDITSASDQERGLGLRFETGNFGGPLPVLGR